MARKPSDRPIRKRRLIVVDGTTEKIYLDIIKQKIRGASIDVKQVNPSGAEAISSALRNCRKEAESKHIHYKHCYIVIDKDDLTVEDFNQILQDERNNADVTLVFSNEAFEVWLLAHIEVMKPGIISRAKLNSKLTKFLKEDYDKTNRKQILRIINEAEPNYIDTLISNTNSINSISYSKQCTNFGILLDVLKS